jgi:hypothetical protein
MKNFLRALLTCALLFGNIAFAAANGTDEMDVGFLAVAGAYATPIIIVLTITVFDSYNRQRMFSTIDNAIQAGVEVPPAVLEALDKPAKAASTLKKGLVWCGLGLGILVAWSVFRNFNEASLGFIPLFVGIAYLIGARLEPDPKSDE